MELFESNHPKYFAEHERPLFDKWLDNCNREEYFVAIKDAEILACGGVFLDDRFNKAGLSWGMVHSDHHGKGIGREFTQFRVNKMKELFPKHPAMLETSQFTFGFYEKMGFTIKKIEANGFGGGFDKYSMERPG
tara:strand:+ start:803 stop:1204 length:402 start_codon:yes stop_codon:yes gene_type:complete